MARRKGLNRREFLWLTSIATSGVVVPSVLTGCAVDPVTGQRRLLLLSEEQEIEIDQSQSPHQFSADYGIYPDDELGRYVRQIGQQVASRSHRSHMPYNFNVVNANYVNAYTFPAGSMGITRGIMLDMQSEAELAALLGHEAGHVNARHAAERATRGMLAQMAVGATAAVAGDGTLGSVVSGVGAISATALLARYSRENEREADRLGMDYMVASGANPQGMVDLMGMLRAMNDRQPGSMEVMFSSHPMSDERYANVQRQLNSDYRSETSRATQRERYMDNTARLRRRSDTIRALRDAEMAIGRQEYSNANAKLAEARRSTPDDYPAWVITAKAQMMQDQPTQAIESLRRARQIQPEEGQAMYLLGINLLSQDDAGGALTEFQRYEQVLPGNPNTRFLVGYSHEQQDNKPQAATAYQDYLRQVQQGQQAEYAFGRLREWGYL